jgi:hypothetical protein
VDGFELSDLSAGSGTLSNLISGAGTSFTATFTPTAGISAPSNVISLAAGSYQDLAGNGGTAASSESYSVDTAPPAIPSIDGFAEDTPPTGDNKTTDTTLTLNGKAEAGSTVNLFDGATPLGATTALVGGTWSFNTAALSLGGHSFTATATDPAGNTSAPSAALAITIESPGPSAPTDQSDVIIGTQAGETITGVPQNSALRGQGSIDMLTGNGGDDLFLLGDEIGRFYDDDNNATAGNSDFGYIKDFTAGDRIQLHGRPEDYVLGSGRFDRNSPRATLIYYKNPDRPSTASPTQPWSRDEWIGMVLTSDSSSPLDLNSPSQFTYVPVV